MYNTYVHIVLYDYTYIYIFFVLVYPENSEAQYFADQTGVFEIVQAKDITHGKVMKQV